MTSPPAPPTASLRSFARDALLPKDAFGRAVLALVALRTPAIWLLSWLVRGEPLTVTAMYRPGGDVQYYEIVAAFGHGNLGESNVLEMAGRGVQPFPLGSIWFHSLLVGLAGPWGMLLADTIVTVLGFVALAVLARACSLGPRAAAAFGGFVTAYLYIALAPLTDRLGWGRDLFWGDRFPRPFLTEIYVALSFAALMRLWMSRTTRGGEGTAPAPLGDAFWAFCGVTFSLLLQSDIYAAFILGLVYAIVLAHRLLVEPSRRTETLRGAAVLAVVTGATAWPFALQRMGTTQELLERWGVYKVSRGAALSWIRYAGFAGPLIVAAVAGAIFLWARRDKAVAASPARSMAVFWCAATGAALLAFPLFFAILGQAIYPSMFPDRLRRVAMWGVAFMVLPAVAAWWESSRFAQGSPTKGDAPAAWSKLTRVLAAGLLVAMGGGIAARAVETLRKEDHVRTWYRLGKGVSYRTAFTELVRELGKPAYKGAKVLGTLDQQVHVHWQTWGGGSAFVPDGFVSIAPDAELERRFLTFCKIVGVPADELPALLAEPSHNGLVFVSKYGTNTAHLLSPLPDYTEAQQKRILARSPLISFAYEVPVPELERFQKLYADPGLTDSPPRLDLIVLTNDGRYGKYAPPASEFDLVFQNAVFRMYSKKAG